MSLNKESITRIDSSKGISIPSSAYFDLPEKVLQFGTGVLLRGLPDYFIDKANKQGIFNGRVVIVKSTASGGTDAFATQDGLYTLCVRGIEQGIPVEETIVNASVSRVLSAKDDWKQVLACAANPEMTVIVSNTTEVGIALEEDDIDANPPSSFPGKLTAFLYERYKIFKGATDKGFAIVPTELITDNGKKLKDIVLELAKRAHLEDDFINWLHTANEFCNTLVDRIVPGKMTATDKAEAEAFTGYTDELMIMSEVYRLWAIETTDEQTKARLSFAAADAGVVLTSDITKYKELKLRLLNGSHTFTCGLAIAMGFTTVKEAMQDTAFKTFLKELMQQEIIPAISTDDISEQEAAVFANSVVDRFSNPFLEHLWINITMQYSLKMKSRCVPIIQWYFERKQAVPAHIAKGFAAYILFMKSEEKDGSYIGSLNGKSYTITDQHASLLADKWKQYTGIELVESVLADTALWEQSLAVLPGFADAVHAELQALINK